jgi:hypothetical protein
LGINRVPRIRAIFVVVPSFVVTVSAPGLAAYEGMSQGTKGVPDAAQTPGSQLVVCVREALSLGRFYVRSSEAAVSVLFNVGMANHGRVGEVYLGKAQNRFPQTMSAKRR